MTLTWLFARLNLLRNLCAYLIFCARESPCFGYWVIAVFYGTLFLEWRLRREFELTNHFKWRRRMYTLWCSLTFPSTIDCRCPNLILTHLIGVDIDRSFLICFEGRVRDYTCSSFDGPLIDSNTVIISLIHAVIILELRLLVHSEFCNELL